MADRKPDTLTDGAHRRYAAERLFSPLPPASWRARCFSAVAGLVWVGAIVIGLAILVLMWSIILRPETNTIEGSMIAALGAAHLIGVYCGAQALTAILREVRNVYPG